MVNEQQILNERLHQEIRNMQIVYDKAKRTAKYSLGLLGRSKTQETERGLHRLRRLDQISDRVIQTRMLMTPDQTLFAPPTYTILGCGRETEVRVGESFASGIPVYPITIYDRQTHALAYDISLTEMGQASKRARIEAVELARRYAQQDYARFEDHMQEDTNNLFENIKGIHRRIYNSELDANWEPADMKGVPLREKFGL